MRHFIGDVHGCSKELQLMVNTIRSKDSMAKIFCVGDLINKGPNSFEVLQIVLKEKIRCIRGNHEELFIRIMRQKPENLSVKERYYYDLWEGKQQEAYNIISKWPLWLQWEDILLVHAGLQPGIEKISKMHPRIITTIRTWDGEGSYLKKPENPAWYDCLDWEKIVIYGHWAQAGLKIRPKTKGLDSGCVYGKQLTSWCPETDEYIQINALENYYKLP
jgi:hypothetical protein